MATDFSILIWKIPWTEEPGKLFSPRGHRESDMTEYTADTCTFKYPMPALKMFLILSPMP